ncbi:hypothetical protein R1flu_004367 [Riccia fluitans]|uniref:Protein XRI1 n=1 Tax=Riccia fluitans TaxID=41844 RepID=A0ABD1YQN3_9MARC
MLGKLTQREYSGGAIAEECCSTEELAGKTTLKLAEMTMSGVSANETCDDSWLNFLWSEEGNQDGGPALSLPIFDPVPDEKEIYIDYVEDLDKKGVSHDDYQPAFGDGALWPKRRRLLFRQYGSDSSTLSTSQSCVVDVESLRSASTHDKTPWPLTSGFRGSLHEALRHSDIFPESDISQWLRSYSREYHLDEEMESPTGTQEMQATSCHYQAFTNEHDQPIGTNRQRISKLSQNADPLSPTTPDPSHGKKILTELRKDEVLQVRGQSGPSAPCTSQEDSTSTRCSSSPRPSRILHCQPFAILKPEGVKISDINEFLRSPSSKIAQCSEASDYSFTSSSCKRDISVGFSGKPIFARTRIITKNNGTLTIIRTANH